jgi:hypothetical protein
MLDILQHLFLSECKCKEKATQDNWTFLIVNNAIHAYNNMLKLWKQDIQEAYDYALLLHTVWNICKCFTHLEPSGYSTQG